MAPEHLLLTLKEDGRVHVQDLGSRNGQDLGSRNGAQLNGQRLDAEFGRIVTGGELWIGRTRVRVRTAEETVDPERPFQRDTLLRHRTVLAACGLLLCFTFAAFLQWTHAPEQLAQSILLAELAAVAGLAIW